MEKNVAGKWVVFAYGLPSHASAGQPITGDAANITANVRIDGGAANAVDDTNPTELEDGYYIFDITATENNGDLICITPASATANVQVIGVPGAVYTRPPNFNAFGIASDGDISGNLDGAVATVTTLTGHTAQTGDSFARIGAPVGASISADLVVVDGNVDSVLADTELLGYLGGRGYGVYVDSNAANTSTTTGVDGTFDNPVSTLTAARTIANALSAARYYVLPSSTFTIAATHVDWEFVGDGPTLGKTINLGSQDVSGSRFFNVVLEGDQGGSGRIEAERCALQAPGAGTTTLHVIADYCAIVDDITLDTSNDNVLLNCLSFIAGSGSPIIRASGATGTLQLRGYQGGIDLRDLSATHTLSIEEVGQVIFDSSCNVNAAITLRGIGTITDNTAGMNNLMQDAFLNMPKITATTDDIRGTAFNTTNHSLVAIIDRGDAAWTTGAGGTPPQLLQSTTIATLASQTSFTLTAGSADNDAYNGAVVVVTDSVTAVQKAVGSVSDYVGSTKQVILVADPAIFTMAIGDTIDIIANASTAPTAAQNRAEMDSNSTQLAAIIADTGTTIPAQITGLNDLSAAQVNTEVDTALTDYDAPTKAELDSGFAALNDVAATDIVSAGAITTLAGAVVNVDLVDTTTTNTDMRGTDSANTTTPPTSAAIADAVLDEALSGHTTAGTLGKALADVEIDATAILADTNELQADDIPGLIAALNDISVADILSGSVTELTSVPGASPALKDAIALLYMALRNKLDVTATAKEVHNSAGTVLATKTLSDDGTTYSEGKMS